MTPLEIVVTGNTTGAVTSLQKVQGELGKTVAVSKTASSAFTGIGSSISSLGSSLISGGILTGVALLGAGLYQLAQNAFGATKAQQQLTDVLEGAKSAYVGATQQVERMKIAFEQARNGIITKEEALKLYNSTIGKTIGQTKNLDEAEAMFIAQADNYIKFTLLKAAANIALGKAAEAAFKAEQERLVPRKQTLTESFLTQGRVSDKEAQQYRINKAIKEENTFRAIALSLQEQAKAFGFDYNAIAEKDVKLQKEKTVQLKKQKDILIDTKHFNVLDFDKLLKIDRNVGVPELTIKPNVTIVPNVKAVVITPEQQANVLKGMQALFDKDKLDKFQADATDAINETIFNIINDTISTMTDAIGNILAGNKDAVPRLFDNLIKGIGQQIKELGKYLVKAGLEMLGAKKAIALLGLTPQGAIIAGIALQVLGAFLTAAANKKANSVGFASGTSALGQGTFANVGERGPERVFLPRGASVQPNNQMAAYAGGNGGYIAETRIAATDLVILLRKGEQQMGRNN